MPAPLIAVTATTKVTDGVPRVRLNEAYVTAVRNAGLTPLIVAPMNPDEAADVLDAVQGLLLTGGEDVDPAAYGQARGPNTEDPHQLRDRTELALVSAARERALPTLAICRGLQLVNVALGGTLIQDIPTDVAGAALHSVKNRGERVHDVAVERESMLARAVRGTNLRVNTSHHQALDRPGKGLEVSARAPDGIVEGAEWTGSDWWMIGVQWHPEELVTAAEPWDRDLFSAFAAAVLSTR